MTKNCNHEVVYKAILPQPPKEKDDLICLCKMACPECQRPLEVHFVKTLPMVDDVELSPEWCVQGFKEC
jgi:hypothetical protein